MGCLGRRPVLPQHRHRPDWCRGAGAGQERGHRRYGGRYPHVRRLAGDPAAHAASRRQAPRLRDRGRLARAGEVPQGRLPGRRARRSVSGRDPVRPCLPPDPLQHQLGGGQVRDLRSSLPAHRRGRLGGGAGQRLHLRPRRHQPGAGGRGHHHNGPAVPGPGTALSRSGHRPGHPHVPLRVRARGRDRRRGSRGLPHQPAGTRRQRRGGHGGRSLPGGGQRSRGDRSRQAGRRPVR